MHTTSKIVEEIVELCVIKSAYNHYLCTCNPKLEVENYTYILNNKAVLSHHLKALYIALAEEKEKQKQTQQPRTPQIRRIKYKASKQEERAIFHFYSDKRYKLTE